VIDPRRPMTAWWRGSSIRARLVILSVVPLAAALVVGTVALVVIFSTGRLRAVDRQTSQEASTLAGLVNTGQVTSPLPIPAGSPLFAQIVTPSGVVLGATASASLVLPLTTPPPDSSHATNLTDDDNPFGGAALRLRLHPATLNGQAVWIIVAAPLTDVRSAVQSLKIVLLLLVPALVALVALLEWLVIGLTLRPVENLRSAAADLAVRAPLPTRASAGPPLLPVGQGDDEISRLAATLNDLIHRLQQSLTTQRDFVADAAHELRSPLASLKVQLDVARAHPGLVTNAQLVAEVSTEVDRLVRISDDLLLLGRLDSGEELRREPVDLRTITGSATGPSLLVDGDPEALERLLRNVTDNAAKQATLVQTTTSQVDGFVVIDIDDDGPGIPIADRERVFERWVRLDTARDRQAGGSGLGLALVKEIAVAHGGSVSIEDSSMGGTRVSIRIPMRDADAGGPDLAQVEPTLRTI
jgi:signal transduction histidine kinase